MSKMQSGACLQAFLSPASVTKSALPEGGAAGQVLAMTESGPAWQDSLVANASAERAGAVRIGENLLIDENGVLRVDTAAAVEQDNTRPVTSAAVHTQLGNVEALLKNI